MSYTGAWVNYITKLLPIVLRQDMEIDSIVVRVGFNTIMKAALNSWNWILKSWLTLC
jgi:hypothetical protein